jgi:hypothetical protein
MDLWRSKTIEALLYVFHRFPESEESKEVSIFPDFKKRKEG